LQAQVIILSFRESVASDFFLQNIQKALVSYNFPTLLLPVKSPEETKQFLEEAQATIVLSSKKLFQTQALLPLITELPSTQKHVIGKSLLILLEPFEQYFTDKNAKKNLWNMLCKTLMQNSLPASS
jgi:hypothetical protein